MSAIWSGLWWAVIGCGIQRYLHMLSHFYHSVGNHGDRSNSKSHRHWCNPGCKVLLDTRQDLSEYKDSYRGCFRSICHTSNIIHNGLRFYLHSFCRHRTEWSRHCSYTSRILLCSHNCGRRVHDNTCTRWYLKNRGWGEGHTMNSPMFYTWTVNCSWSLSQGSSGERQE